MPSQDKCNSNVQIISFLSIIVKTIYYLSNSCAKMVINLLVLVCMEGKSVNRQEQ